MLYLFVDDDAIDNRCQIACHAVDEPRRPLQLAATATPADQSSDSEDERKTRHPYSSWPANDRFLNTIMQCYLFHKLELDSYVIYFKPS